MKKIQMHVETLREFEYSRVQYTCVGLVEMVLR